MEAASKSNLRAATVALMPFSLLEATSSASSARPPNWPDLRCDYQIDLFFAERLKESAERAVWRLMRHRSSGVLAKVERVLPELIFVDSTRAAQFQKYPPNPR